MFNVQQMSPLIDHDNQTNLDNEDNQTILLHQLITTWQS